MWTPHRQAWGGSALGSGGLGLRRRTGKAKPTARRPSTPRPPGGCMEQARAPVRPAALCCPPVAAAQGPALPPRVHSSAAGARGWGAGSWGGGRARLSGRGPQGPGHPPTLQPRHTLPTPGDPRAAPRKGVTHTQTAPSPHWCSYHPGAASPARQSSKEPGPESGPGAPFIMAADLALLTPTQAHRGSQPSVTRGAARSHTAASGAARASARLTPAPRRPGVSAWLCSRRHEWAVVPSVKEPRGTQPLGPKPLPLGSSESWPWAQSWGLTHTPHQFPSPALALGFLEGPVPRPLLLRQGPALRTALREAHAPVSRAGQAAQGLQTR